jgi:hypothetical protein
LNKEGVSSNTSSESVEAISYALAKEMKTDDFYIQNSKDYKAPQIVEKLPPKTDLNSGASAENAEEVPGAPEDYYDGTRGLKITRTECNQYTTQPEVCLHQGSCGWCGSSNSCIQGNNLGPLAPCLRGTYKFTEPNNFNPLPTNNVSVQKANIAGAQLTTIVPNQ